MSEKIPSSVRKLILILEDNDELVELLKDMMSNRSDEIISVSTAEKAQPLLRERKFDLLICDLHLPGMSGAEFLNICQAEKILPKNVMIISGDIQNPELKPEFFKQFICLEKPFFVEKFPALVNEVLSKD
ncbi:MAG: response regulator [Bdellovibrionota bacterium]